MVFFFGFFLTMAGIALLLSGGFRLKTKRLPKRAARWAGGTFVAFFPLVLLVVFVARKFDPEESVPPDIYFWSLAILDLGVGLTFYFRGLRPLGGRPSQGTAGLSPLDPFAVDPFPNVPSPATVPEPEPPRTPQKSRPAAGEPKGGSPPSSPSPSPFEPPGDNQAGNNPFDFT